MSHDCEQIPQMLPLSYFMLILPVNLNLFSIMKHNYVENIGLIQKNIDISPHLYFIIIFKLNHTKFIAEVLGGVKTDTRRRCIILMSIDLLIGTIGYQQIFPNIDIAPTFIPAAKIVVPKNVIYRF